MAPRTAWLACSRRPAACQMHRQRRPRRAHSRVRPRRWYWRMRQLRTKPRRGPQLRTAQPRRGPQMRTARPRPGGFKRPSCAFRARQGLATLVARKQRLGTRWAIFHNASCAPKSVWRPPTTQFLFPCETLSRVSLREAEADKVRDALLAAVAKTGLERKAQPEKKRKDANPKA